MDARGETGDSDNSLAMTAKPPKCTSAQGRHIRLAAACSLNKVNETSYQRDLDMLPKAIDHGCCMRCKQHA